MFASHYSKLLPLQLAGQYLQAAVQVLESNGTGAPVKISAIKAIHKSVDTYSYVSLFSEFSMSWISFCNEGEDSAISPFASRITRDLGPFLLSASEDTLSLVLETIAVILEVDQGKWLTVDLATSLVNAALQVWEGNNKGEPLNCPLRSRPTDLFPFYLDPIFVSVLSDIVENLASSKTPGIYEAVVKQALPPLGLAIGSAKKVESWIAASGIELVSSLVQGSPHSGLGDGFFQVLAPQLFSCLSRAEDRDVLQVTPPLARVFGTDLV